MEYDIVVGSPWDAPKFVKRVNKRLKDGWQLHGPPSTAAGDESGPVVVQAIVREKTRKTKPAKRKAAKKKAPAAKKIAKKKGSRATAA